MSTSRVVRERQDMETVVMTEWQEYQDEVAEVFRGLGFHTKVDQPVKGVRTNHKIDVLVEGEHIGFELTWLVECKYWKTSVTKGEVLTLRQIVNDVGANRGFILAESDFQSGALEAACYTNISLVSLHQLKDIVGYETSRAKLLSIVDRADSCADRYWNMAQEDRIKFGLRPDPGGPGYMSDAVFRAVTLTARQALIGGFPIIYDKFLAATAASTGKMRYMAEKNRGDTIETPSELYEILDGELSELESLLENAEAALRRENC